MRWQQGIEAFLQEILQLDPDQKIWLLHHADCDGCVSALYLMNLLKELRIGVDRRFWILSAEYDLQRQKEIIKEDPPDVLIFLDLDVISDGILLGDWKEGVKKILIYDHHKIDEEELNEFLQEGLVHVYYLNPRRLEERRGCPSCLFCYQLYEKFIGSGPNAWLVGAGLIGDHAFDDYPDIKEIILEDFKNSMKNAPAGKQKLSEITSLINAGYFHKDSRRKDLSFEVALNAFIQSEPNLFFDLSIKNVKELDERKRQIDSECKRFIGMAKKEARLYPEALLCVYLIDTPHYISGLVASALTSVFPAYLILVGQKVANKWSFEIRSGNSCGIDITDVLRRQRENYRSLSAGGHPRASGALIKAEELEIFLTTFKEALEGILALNR